MNENEFELCGVVYVSKLAIADDEGLIGCDGCHISSEVCVLPPRPPCNKLYRKDLIDVIFVEKHS